MANKKPKDHDYSLENYIEKGWDIRKVSIPPINEEFFDRFVEDNVKGDDDYIVVGGLVALAHEKGYCGDKTEVLQYPKKENKETIIVRVTVEGFYYNKYSGNVEKGSWSAIGDASPSSLNNKFIVPHMIRMAETRALGRALRKYLNIPMLCAEEMGSIIDQPRITKSQIKEINELRSDREFTQEECEEYLQAVLGRRRLGKEATSGEADILIRWLISQDCKASSENLESEK